MIFRSHLMNKKSYWLFLLNIKKRYYEWIIFLSPIWNDFMVIMHVVFKLTFFNIEQGLQRTLVAAQNISKITNDFFNDLSNQASRFLMILEENHAEKCHQLANFRKSFQVRNSFGWICSCFIWQKKIRYINKWNFYFVPRKHPLKRRMRLLKRLLESYQRWHRWK